MSLGMKRAVETRSPEQLILQYSECSEEIMNILGKYKVDSKNAIIILGIIIHRVVEKTEEAFTEEMKK